MIHRHYLDFEIFPNSNPHTLVFVDTSQYMEEPERPLLQVTLPGHSKYHTVNIVHSRVNTINSNLLGLTETLSVSNLASLPDGVYELTYRICPYDQLFVHKYHLRTTELDCLIEKIHTHVQDLDCGDCDDDKLKRKIVDILLLVETARALANQGEVKRAQEFYRKANKTASLLLEKLEGHGLSL